MNVKAPISGYFLLPQRPYLSLKVWREAYAILQVEYFNGGMPPLHADSHTRPAFSAAQIKICLRHWWVLAVVCIVVNEVALLLGLFEGTLLTGCQDEVVMLTDLVHNTLSFH